MTIKRTLYISVLKIKDVDAALTANYERLFDYLSDMGRTAECGLLEWARIFQVDSGREISILRIRKDITRKGVKENGTK